MRVSASELASGSRRVQRGFAREIGDDKRTLSADITVALEMQLRKIKTLSSAQFELVANSLASFSARTYLAANAMHERNTLTQNSISSSRLRHI